VKADGHTLIEIAASFARDVPATNSLASMMGASVIVFLFRVRRSLQSYLVALKINQALADILAKVGPVGAVPHAFRSSCFYTPLRTPISPRLAGSKVSSTFVISSATR